MDYTQLSTDTLLNQKTWRVIDSVDKATPCDIDVPFFLWTPCGYSRLLAEGKLDSDEISLYYADTVWLNDLSIKVSKKFGAGHIKFYDISRGRDILLDIVLGKDIFGSKRGRSGVVVGIWHDVWIETGKRKKQIESSYSGLDISRGCRFNKVQSLAHREIPGSRCEFFSYGVSRMPYSVAYKGKQLNDVYRAFLCGSWAVMLQEDMSFHTLVSLKGVRQSELVVEDFLYTVDAEVKELMRK